MAVTIERFDRQGGWTPPWIRHEHLGRYEWACTLIGGCRVIDAACGTGYGAQMMAQRGAVRVDGFDVSAEAVRQARSSYPETDILRFAVADVTRLPVPDDSYDAYVCFETIEHVGDDHALLTEAARVLRPGGKLICSTPNRDLLDPGTSIDDRPFNPFHVREYTPGEFDSLLREHFQTVSRFGQTCYGRRYGKLLDAVGRSLPRLAVRMHQVRKLCGIPWESRQKHYPAEITDDRVPEVLIAVVT